MKKIMLVISAVITLYSCGSDTEKSESNNKEATVEDAGDDGAPSYDPNRGEGKYTTVELGATLDAAMAGEGNKVFDVKCSSCHKLTDEKLVGPGWAGVTSRHKPEWIMNFITNTDAMMPNQSLSDNEARQLLEFMRKNDGVK